MEKLKIPTQINLAWELMPGIGSQELRRSLLLLIPGLIVTILLGSVLPGAGVGLGCILGYLLFVFAVYSFFVKIDGSQSIYTYLRDLRRFRREQQSYYYDAGKECVSDDAE